MGVKYDKNERTNWKWEAYCEDQPNIRGVGETRDQALQNLTEQLRAIIDAVLLAQGRLCND